MIKGLYSAASAMIAGFNRQQTLAHNVANLDTAGFKQILTSLEKWIDTPVTAGAMEGWMAGLRSLGEVGLGVETTPDTTDFSQGSIKYTGHALDLAVEGSGFFRVSTSAGERYTRDGRFLRDANGMLVTIDGYPVLDKNGQPIKLPNGEIGVSADGTITDPTGQISGQIGLAAFTDPAAELVRDGENTFLAAGAPSGADPGTIQQCALEMSNANPTQLMTQLVEVQRTYQAAQQMVQIQDELLQKSIATLGRIG